MIHTAPSSGRCPQCHHPFQAPASRSWSRRTPGKADEGGQGAGRAGPAPAQGAVREHQGGLAVPPADQGKAVVPPLVCREGGMGGPGRAPASSPAAAPTSTSSWSTCHKKNSRAAGRQGARPGRWGQGV